MRVIGIDIDGTALDHPEKVNALYEQWDTFIVLYSARSEAVRDITVQQLFEKGIRYHALVLGKLRCDIYIDDKTVGGPVWPE